MGDDSYKQHLSAVIQAAKERERLLVTDLEETREFIAASGRELQRLTNGNPGGTPAQSLPAPTEPRKSTKKETISSVLRNSPTGLKSGEIYERCQTQNKEISRDDVSRVLYKLGQEGRAKKDGSQYSWIKSKNDQE
ncbi:MAG: hypothetical protein QOC96_3627 [Acidobacteriota bacterium]|jgi:hypothetical protein|nr:hypothetical protein [Acidobacteriota bacterium]